MGCRESFVCSTQPASRSPRVSTQTFPSSIRRIYTMGFVQCCTLSVWQIRPSHKCLICGFCSSDQGFASGFLQIPPHDGHPCLQLTVPTAKPVTDFHRLACAHVGRTKKREQALNKAALFQFITNYLL